MTANLLPTATFVNYISGELILDILKDYMHTTPTLLAEGRLPETFGGWSEGRPLRAGLVSLHSGGSGQRAGRH